MDSRSYTNTRFLSLACEPGCNQEHTRLRRFRDYSVELHSIIDNHIIGLRKKHSN